MCDPEVLLLGLSQEKGKHTSTQVCISIIHSTIVHNSRKMEMTQVTVNWGIGKQNVVYSFRRYCYSTIKGNATLQHVTG